MKLSRALLVMCLVLFTAAAVRSETGTMSVQVKGGQLRSTPSFLGAVVGPVSYGERVEAIQQQGEWVDVKTSQNQKGWIHQSALTKKQVIMGAGGQTVANAASGQEIALAGKGFNADVESKYKSTHRNADYASVDRMEAITVSREDMVRFLTEGAIKPEGGVK